jgi:hypothetical protein
MLMTFGFPSSRSIRDENSLICIIQNQPALSMASEISERYIRHLLDNKVL